MKKIILLLLTVMVVGVLQAQQSKTAFQTNQAKLKISATMDGQLFEWENNDITVSLNYKTGEIRVKLRNVDFYDPKHPENFVTDTVVFQKEYELTGHFPIKELIEQSTHQQEYKVELQLLDPQRGALGSMLFDMNVTRPHTTNNGNYRVFVLSGVFDHRDFSLPLFTKFDPEIKVILAFSGLVMGN